MSSPSSSQPTPRLPALDALRGVAMLLGVALHALIPYMEQSVPHLLWPVREPGGPAFDAAYWWIHGFRVQLFFLLSGVLAAASIAKSGPSAFARQRLSRLGVPLVTASVVVVAGMMYPVWALGWVRTGVAELNNVLEVRFAPGIKDDLYGPAHLWFLEYLLVYCLLLAAARRWLAPSPGPVPGPARSGWPPIGSILMLAAVTSGWLLVDPRCLIEFHNRFMPRTSEFVYHGLFFAAGVAGWRWRGDLVMLSGWWWGPLLAAQLIFPWYLREVSAWTGPGNAAAAALASAYGWASVLGWLGFALRVVKRSGPVTRFLAARAFWLYLVHPPLVGLMQVLLLEQPLAAWLKFTLSFAVATLTGLAAHGPAMRLAAQLKRVAASRSHAASESKGEPVPGP